jgi:hypothetical protein
MLLAPGAHQRGAAGLQPHKPPKPKIKKNTDFEDIKVFRDLPSN